MVFGDSGAVNVIAEPDGASTWFPAMNHPLDKALYRFEISVPSRGSLQQQAHFWRRPRMAPIPAYI